MPPPEERRRQPHRVSDRERGVAASGTEALDAPARGSRIPPSFAHEGRLAPSFAHESRGGPSFAHGWRHMPPSFAHPARAPGVLPRICAGSGPEGRDALNPSLQPRVRKSGLGGFRVRKSGLGGTVGDANARATWAEASDASVPGQPLRPVPALGTGCQPAGWARQDAHFSRFATALSRGPSCAAHFLRFATALRRGALPASHRES